MSYDWPMYYILVDKTPVAVDVVNVYQSANRES